MSSSSTNSFNTILVDPLYQNTVVHGNGYIIYIDINYKLITRGESEFAKYVRSFGDIYAIDITYSYQSIPELIAILTQNNNVLSFYHQPETKKCRHWYSDTFDIQALKLTYIYSKLYAITANKTITPVAIQNEHQTNKHYDKYLTSLSDIHDFCHIDSKHYIILTHNSELHYHKYDCEPIQDALTLLQKNIKSISSVGYHNLYALTHDNELSTITFSYDIHLNMYIESTITNNINFFRNNYAMTITDGQAIRIVCPANSVSYEKYANKLEKLTNIARLIVFVSGPQFVILHTDGSITSFNDTLVINDIDETPLKSCTVHQNILL